MLKIFHSYRKLDFVQLMQVYEQSNREWGLAHYPQQPAGQRALQTEQDIYGHLQCFFQEPKAFYAVWAPKGRYLAALRMEPYRDGLLLEALETAPVARRKGCAKKLVHAVLSELAEQGRATVYSHVSKNNEASLAVHKACGFVIISDHAVYADGSVSQAAYTFRYEL